MYVSKLRQYLSRGIYAGSVGCGLHWYTRRYTRQKVVILAYHRLHAGEADALENVDGQYVHVKQFARQMRYLKAHFQVVPLDRCLDQDATTHRAVITFDDAYASVYHHAYPILRSLDLPATIFVPTQFVARRELMWWDRLRTAIRFSKASAIAVPCGQSQQLLPLRSARDKRQTLHALSTMLRRVSDSVREQILAALQPEPAAMGVTEQNGPLSLTQIRTMASAGVTFASHGDSHRSFVTLSSEELATEVSTSKALIEEWTGQAVTWLAYPYGDFDERAADVLTAAGYRGAVTTRDELAECRSPFMVPRIAVGGQTTYAQFVAAVSGVRELFWRGL